MERPTDRSQTLRLLELLQTRRDYWKNQWETATNSDQHPAGSLGPMMLLEEYVQLIDACLELIRKMEREAA